MWEDHNPDRHTVGAGVGGVPYHGQASQSSLFANPLGGSVGPTGPVGPTSAGSSAPAPTTGPTGAAGTISGAGAQAGNTGPNQVPGYAQQALDIMAASRKYGVPIYILLGIYGHESSFGTAYSSGETTYGYMGLTSPGIWNANMTFAQDMDEAAKVVKQNYTSHGKDWNAALLAYSGNSYGLASAESMAKQAPSGLTHYITDPTNQPPTGGLGGIPGVGTIASAIGSLVSGIGSFFSLFTKLFQLSTWEMILKILAGIALIFFGIKWMANG